MPPPIPVIPEMIEVIKAAIVRIISDVGDSAIFLSTNILDYEAAIEFLYISTREDRKGRWVPKAIHYHYRV